MKYLKLIVKSPWIIIIILCIILFLILEFLLHIKDSIRIKKKPNTAISRFIYEPNQKKLSYKIRKSSNKMGEYLIALLKK